MYKYMGKDVRALANFMLLVLLCVWWAYINSSGLVDKDTQRYLFGAAYGVVALMGGIWGLEIAQQWGGFKSIIGKAISFLSLGLLAEEFGQIVFSYYNIIRHVDVPYPSLADVGFFANIPLYLIGIIYLAKASGGFLKFKRNATKLIQVILFPTFLLALSYFVLLKDHQYNWSNPLTVFLDLAYPLGQAIYLSVALLTYSLSRNLLGGVMKNKVAFLIFAFLCQYIADYNFLYQNSRQTWVNGGYGDLLYLIAYFMMTFGLLQLSISLVKLKDK